MKDYLPIWRLLPKASVGLAFSFFVVLALGGVQGVAFTMQAARQFFIGFQSEFSAIIVSAFFLGTISTLGFQLAHILSSALGAVARKAIGFSISNPSASNQMLVDLVAPVSDIVRRTFQANVEFFIRHYALKRKSAGGEKLEQLEAITAHFENVRAHARDIRDWELICAQAYQESLSQDQRKLESMEEEIAIETSLTALLIVAFPIVLIRMWELRHGLAISSGVTLLALGVAGVPACVNRKRRFAQILLASYLDVFTVAELTEYLEREGEPKL